MTVLIVTGTPSTGKTTIATFLARSFRLRYVDLFFFIKKNKIADFYDPRLKTFLVDTKKLLTFLLPLLKQKEDLIIDSHLSHFIPPRYVDLCIVVKCRPSLLRKRLQKRKYSETKIQENIDAENFDVCLQEAQETGHRLFLIDTTHIVHKRFLLKELRKIISRNI